MNRLAISSLRDRVSDRDVAILHDVEAFRFASTDHIRRLHFHLGHHTLTAATRACTRVLHRLRDLDLVRSLARRIGGVRRGSAGFIWHLGPSGDRLLRHQRGDPIRRRFTEPSTRFLDHTLAITELATQLRQAAAAGSIELPLLRTEPASWQASLNRHGLTETLKPDLHVVTATAEFEDHWFIELDNGTEHLPVLLRQCRAYQRFAATGRYQHDHGLHPAVLWILPNTGRLKALQASVAADPQLPDGLFRYTTTGQALAAMTSGGTTGTGETLSL